MTARFVELTAIDLRKEKEWLLAQRQTSSSAVRELDFNEDDLEMPIQGEEIEEVVATVAAASDPSLAPDGMYYTIAVFEGDLREFYARKGSRTGTRLVYKNGAARPVKEAYAEVKKLFAALK